MPISIRFAESYAVRMMATEHRAIEAAAERLSAWLGARAADQRVTRRISSGHDVLLDHGGILPGRAHELVLDAAVVVWRGSWTAEGSSTHWGSRWIIAPELIRRH